MPKSKPRLTLNLNLLKPQSNPEKIPVKLFHWLLSSGRYIFVAVNALVLIAFGTRFKLDADLASKKEAIDEQIPYIESLRPYEILIRQTQLKLATIEQNKRTALDWPAIFQKIAGQTPQSIKITNISIENKSGTTAVHITGQTQNSNDITNFINGLKNDPSFRDVNLAGVGLEEKIINFNIDTSVKLVSGAI